MWRYYEVSSCTNQTLFCLYTVNTYAHKYDISFSLDSTPHSLSDTTDNISHTLWIMLIPHVFCPSQLCFFTVTKIDAKYQMLRNVTYVYSLMHFLLKCPPFQEGASYRSLKNSIDQVYLRDTAVVLLYT